MTPPPETESYSHAQVLVLERLTRIETMLTVFTEYQGRMDQDLRDAKKTADCAMEKAANAETDISEMKEERKWGTRALAVAFIGILANTVVNAIQGLN